MDQEYMTKMATSFLSELSEIEKNALASGALRFLGSGLGHLTKAVTKKVPMAMSRGGAMASRIGGGGAVRAGGTIPHMKQIWGAGAATAGKRGGSQFMGGLKALGKSRYGQMAGTLAVPVAAGYGASKLL